MLPFYLGVVWGSDVGLQTVNFTFLPGFSLRSMFRSHDCSLYLFTWECSEVQKASRLLILLKTAYFTFLPVGGLTSDVQNQASSRLKSPFYLFTWRWSEVQNPASGCLSLPLYLGVVWGSESGLKTAYFTFLPGGGLWSRIRRRLIFPFHQFYRGVFQGP